MFFTKEYFYVIPFESLKVLGATAESKFHSVSEFISDLYKQIPATSVEDFQAQMKTYLPDERIYRINELNKFTIQVGFWIFGGMRVRRDGKQLQTFNVQPKQLRADLKVFYGLE